MKKITALAKRPLVNTFPSSSLCGSATPCGHLVWPSTCRLPLYQFTSSCAWPRPCPELWSPWVYFLWKSPPNALGICDHPLPSPWLYKIDRGQALSLLHVST